jgi:hypothetical protein
MPRMVERFMATDRAIAKIRKKAKRLQAVPSTCQVRLSAAYPVTLEQFKLFNQNSGLIGPWCRRI